MLGFIKRKTEQAVKRSKDAWFGKINDLFRRSKIDDEVWEELEELLILADVGAQTADTLLHQIKDRVKREKLEEGQQV